MLSFLTEKPEESTLVSDEEREAASARHLTFIGEQEKNLDLLGPSDLSWTEDIYRDYGRQVDADAIKEEIKAANMSAYRETEFNLDWSDPENADLLEGYRQDWKAMTAMPHIERLFPHIGRLIFSDSQALIDNGLKDMQEAFVLQGALDTAIKNSSIGDGFFRNVDDFGSSIVHTFTKVRGLVRAVGEGETDINQTITDIEKVLYSEDPLEKKAEEYSRLIDDYTKGYVGEGNNSFALGSLGKILAHGTYSEAAELETLLSVAELGIEFIPGIGLFGGAASKSATTASKLSRKTLRNGSTPLSSTLTSPTASSKAAKVASSVSTAGKKPKSSPKPVSAAADLKRITAPDGSPLPSPGGNAIIVDGKDWASRTLASELWDDIGTALRNAGKVLAPEDTIRLIDTAVDKATKQALTDGLANRVVGMHMLDDPTGGYTLLQLFGRGGPVSGGGRVFKPTAAGTVPKSVENLAKQVNGEIMNLGSGLVVATRTNLKTTNLKDITPTNLDEVGGGGYFQRILGSASLRTTEAANALLKRGEAASASIMKRMDQEYKSATKLVGGRKKMKGVERVFTRLQQGADINRTKEYDRADFFAAFNKENGVQARDVDFEAYLKVQNILNVQAWMNADLILKKAVDQGGVIVSLDGVVESFVLSKTKKQAQSIDGVDHNAILNADTGKTMTAAEFKSLPPESVLFERAHSGVSFGKGKKNSHVFAWGSNLKTKGLTHTDVFNRNLGGPRIYRPTHASFYVKQVNKATNVVGGKTVKVKGSASDFGTLIGARTSKEAGKAATEVNNVITELKTVLGEDFGVTELLALAKQNTPETRRINDVIDNNSFWNTDISDLESFADFFKSRKLDPSELFSVGRPGERLGTGADDIADFGMFTGMRLVDAINTASFVPNARGARPLQRYGGHAGKGGYIAQETLEDALNMRTGEVAHARAYLGYEQQAGWSLIARIQELVADPINAGRVGGKNSKELREVLQGKTTLKSRLMLLRDKKLISRDDTLGKKINLEVETLLNQMERQSIGQDFMNNKAYDFFAYLYDKPSNKFANKLANVGSWAYDKNPLNFTRRLAFESYLGLGAVDQFWVQASQIVSIASISPKFGSMAVASYPVIRAALLANDPAKWTALHRSLRGSYTLDRSQFLEMIEMFKDSGRNIIDLSVAERGSEILPKNALSKGLHVARTPFREGELAARITAHATAYAEFVSKNPRVSPKSEQGLSTIAQRADILTQSMTSTSRSKFEKLPFFQFMTYSKNINEQLLSSKAGLTGKERAFLATGHLIFYGSAGSVPTSALYQLYSYYKGEANPADDPLLMRAIRGGVSDFALSQLTGVETDVAPRLGGGTVTAEFFLSFYEDGFTSLAVGPGGQQGVGLATDFYGVIANALSADGHGVNDSLLSVMRNISSGNDAYDLYMAYNYQQKVAKNGSLTDSDVTPTEMILDAFGIPRYEISRIWDNRNIERIVDKAFAHQVKTGQKMMNLHVSAVKRNDTDEAARYLENWKALVYTIDPTKRQTFIDRSGVTGHMDEITRHRNEVALRGQQ